VTKAERLAAIFAVAFAAIYAPTMDWTAATYHPIQGIWQLGFAKPLGGGSPAMYWYGFVITAALGAAVLTAIASFVPKSADGTHAMAKSFVAGCDLRHRLRRVRPAALCD
jgi:hypothetical protein